jgi:hypothetical protein
VPSLQEKQFAILKYDHFRLAARMIFRFRNTVVLPRRGGTPRQEGLDSLPNIFRRVETLSKL